MFVFYQKNAWCDNALFMQWINKIFLLYQNSLEEKVLLIFDQATSHLLNESLDYLANNNIDFLITPPGMKSFLQSCDIFS